jgi:type IV pilus assembly protein PilY1
VMVSFGTGQQQPQTNINAAQYATGTQALYGIWDSNLAAWNAKAATSAQYATLSSPPATVAASALQTQTITDLGGGNGTISSYRTISALQICWKGSTNCGSAATSNTKLGWTVPLPTTSEQVIYNPTTEAGMLVVNTTIPAVSQALTCNTQPPTGFTMAVSLDTGGAPPKSSFFPDQTGSFDNGVIAGIGLGGTGTPSFVQTDGLPRLVTQTSSGTPQILTVNPNATTIGQRMTWIKRR